VYDIPRLREIADDVVLTRVDFEGLSRWVLGKYWRTATPQQRAAFIAEFREMLLGSYLRSVSTYEDNAVRFLPLRNSRHEDRVIVNAEVDQPNGPTVHVSFRMRQVGDQWLIYDVAVEGISLVATHRTSFSREIRTSGMDSLIARLRVQNMRNSEEEARLLSVESE
jgi:phospholipid transport system substrate-binding protein